MKSMHAEAEDVDSLVAEFPGLRLGGDAGAVAAELARHRPAWLPASARAHAEIGKSYVKPKHFVRIVYHFYGDGPASTHVWVVGRAAHRDSPPQSAPNHPEGSLTLSDGLVIETFTHDRKLAALAQLTQTDWALDYFERHRWKFAPECTTPLRSVAILPIKYNPGKRAVLRYTLQFEDQFVSTYAKHYRDDHGAFSAAVQSQVHDSLRQRSSRASVPAVYWYDADLRVSFQADWGGERLKKSCPRLDDPAMLRRVLDAAHDLHTVPTPPGVVDRIGTVDLLRTAQGDVRDIANLVPGLEADLHTVYRRAFALLQQPESAPPGFVHGSFLLSQILLRPGQVGFIDFDSAAIGDPLYDVAELLASAVYERWRDGAGLVAIDRFWCEALEAVTDTYGARITSSRAAGYVLVFLLGKTHQHLTSIKYASAADSAALRNLLQHFGRG